jgi:outer membrane immunogenic protein
MKRLILGVAAALLLSAGQAAADGLPSKGVVKAAAPIAGPNWNGFYVGVGVGAGAMVLKDVQSAYYTHEDYTQSATFDGIGGDGIFGTVTVGYDRVIRPGWVAGVFADYDFSNITHSERFSEGGGFSIDHDNAFSIGARLGVLANASTLLYATGGYTQAKFGFGDYFDRSESGTFASDKTFHGYFVGAGVETFLRDNWTLKLEYRFSQFDKETVFALDTICEQDRETLEPSMHTARLVLSYKFGQHD